MTLCVYFSKTGISAVEQIGRRFAHKEYATNTAVYTVVFMALSLIQHHQRLAFVT